MKISKTNAMRILETNQITYQVKEYPHGKDAVEGKEVARLLNQDPEAVFKTLVTQANTKEYLVFAIPVAYELDLKKAAKAANVKSLEMIPVKQITPITGYVRGGCSPIGMKKQFRTFFHETLILFDEIMFSAGKIGLQCIVAPKDILALLDAQTCDLVKD